MGTLRASAGIALLGVGEGGGERKGEGREGVRSSGRREKGQVVAMVESRNECNDWGAGACTWDGEGDGQ